jgi:N-hydroxyarylamine O-acetyltransferase
MVLRVLIDGEPWLADVGFGALCLLEPIPLRDGAAAHQVGITYALRRENQVWVLSCKGSGPSGGGGADSIDLYEFSEDAQTPGDVEVANHYTSTHPDSVFRRTLTIQRTTRTDRTMLRHGMLTRYRNGRAEEEPVDRAQLQSVVRDVFSVELPAGPFLFETNVVSA